ncbi:hypothetical protein F2Q70_00036180 [Brassica cretica]|uniref:Uncharacterized protein n=1 Tax=Brassica cretica TaxID=69181 RepID=A0A8S9JUC5_BRACR|nr:hypothetical protein F2Q70_00036180 [Brassica cretica]
MISSSLTTPTTISSPRARLPKRVAVAVVHHVEAAVHVDADWFSFPEGSNESI